MRPHFLHGRATVAALVSLLSLASSAHAATVTYSSNFGLWPGTFFSDAAFAECTKSFGVSTPCTDQGAAQGTVHVTAFDPTLGALTGITLTLDSQLELGVEVFGNRDGGTSTVRGHAEWAVDSFLGGATQALALTCAGFCNQYTPNGMAPIDTDAQLALAPGAFSTFVGTSPVALSFVERVFTEGSASFANIGVIARTRTVQLGSGPAWHGVLSVTYEYAPTSAPVPEPSVYALAVMGLVAGASRRQRIW